MNGIPSPLATHGEILPYDDAGRAPSNLDATDANPESRPPRVPSPCASEPVDTDDLAEMDREDLLRSFDLLFQMHQRAEDVRTHLEVIDQLLLSSRTASGLAREVARSLAQHLDLTVVRLLFRREHELHAALLWEQPEEVGLLPLGFLENEAPIDNGPFILEDPAGDLAYRLFGARAFSVCSAAVAPLVLEGREIGLLCLGSDDPLRYCGGMNTDVIAALASKIALGLKNAADHEKRSLEALMGPVERVDSELFFREILDREFARAWRYRTVFSVMVMGWRPTGAGPCPADEDLFNLLRSRIRSSDIVAADGSLLWILAPETNEAGAQTLANRLALESAKTFGERLTLCFGVTEFSRSAASASLLMAQARLALDAAERDGRRIVSLPFTTDSCAAHPLPAP